VLLFHALSLSKYYLFKGQSIALCGQTTACMLLLHCVPSQRSSYCFTCRCSLWRTFSGPVVDGGESDQAQGLLLIHLQYTTCATNGPIQANQGFRRCTFPCDRDIVLQFLVFAPIHADSKCSLTTRGLSMLVPQTLP